jgi:phosphatidylinositol alpha-mannosyltransferase
MTLSLSLLAVLSARGPVVATFHTSITRSRALSAAQGLLQMVSEKITARIAVSELARKTQVEHLGGGAVEIPNGVAVRKFASAEPLPGWPGTGGTLGFLGRFTESRKGFPLLRTAFVTLARSQPGLRLLVAGPGAPDDLYDEIPADLRDRVEFLGLVSEPDKARMLRSVDVYVAPNTGGESFGMILTEAMAAGAAIAAADLEAFRRVLDGGRAGALFPTGDAHALTALLGDLLDDPARRAELATCARAAATAFDWPSVANRVLEVYATAIEATDGRVFDEEWAEPRQGR